MRTILLTFSICLIGGSRLIGEETSLSKALSTIKAVRRVVPPLRLGGVGIDLAFLIVALAVQVAANLLR